MAAVNRTNKLAFLSMPAPASYVAGLGRGASGFTTRSDIGPAREGPSAEVVAEAQAKRGEEVEVDPDQFQDPDNEYGLFAGTTYEADDEEADKIYELVDNAMDSRRKARREAAERVEVEQHRVERPKIQLQFADLKRGLSAVSDSEWENLPEAGNLTRRKRRREDRAFVVPDSVLVGDRARSEYDNALDPMQQAAGGFETPAGTLTNFVEIGQARDKILSLKLDQVSANTSVASGLATSIDPKGYLTSLDSVILKSEAEIGDIKRARMLFGSLVKSNPTHPPGWIAFARLEEHAGKMVQARKLIKQGCEHCPKSEDIWLESARLHNNDDAKIILASAAGHVPQSVKIWLAAADLEHDVKVKKRVLRKSLENIPNSVRLWKETVNLEDNPNDARIILARAVEVIPLSVELWLALARLETPERAKAVINKARKAVPTSHEIWIAAARLFEQEITAKRAAEAEDTKVPKDENVNDMVPVDKTIELAVKELRKHQVLLTREQWLKEAEKCEAEGSLSTCEAIVKATVAMELEDNEDDRLDTWLSDVESAESRGMLGTARAILAYALKVYPTKQHLWRRAVDLEKSYGSRTSLDDILLQAVKYCPHAEVFWLMAAKEKWLSGDLNGARMVLGYAFDHNSQSEQIYLAAVKLEAENGEFGPAREILKRARKEANTERVWIKSVVFERQQKEIDTALELLTTALGLFPKCPKLYMIQGQIYQHILKDVPKARAAFAAGYKACPKNPTLWILASRLEEADNRSIKARSILEKARLVNSTADVLWAESYLVEQRAASPPTQTKSLLSRGLQACPASGLLHSLNIWSEPRAVRKTRGVEALTKSGESGLVACTLARIFWSERKLEQARRWFERAVALGKESDNGDCWAWWWKFERAHGGGVQGHINGALPVRKKEEGEEEFKIKKEEDGEDVRMDDVGAKEGDENGKEEVEMEKPEDTVKRRCTQVEPRHGEIWQNVAKDDKNAGKSIGEILELVAERLS